ncbi:unnamed protein product [Lampetra fluviatilis]
MAAPIGEQRGAGPEWGAGDVGGEGSEGGTGGVGSTGGVGCTEDPGGKCGTGDAGEPGLRLRTAALGVSGPQASTQGKICRLRDSLRRDNWKENESAKCEFVRLLLQVARPHVGATLVREALLPPALLFSDDFELENQLLGVRCLHHVVLNTPAAELRCHNQAQVIYHALYRHLYSREHELVQAVHRCLLILLPVLEGPYLANASPGKANPMALTSKVLLLTLSHMEMEDRLSLRRVYAEVLPAYIDRLGILIVRHMKQLLGVVGAFLEVSDGPKEEARAYILLALKSLISCAWPRMAARCGFLVKLLLRFAYDISAERTTVHGSVQRALLTDTADCLVSLDRCCGGQVQALLRDVKKASDNPGVLHCVTTVFSE